MTTPHSSLPGISRRRFLLRASQSAAAMAVLAGCVSMPTIVEYQYPPTPTPPPPTPTATAMPPTATPQPPTPALISSASLEEKIGQMLLAGFQGLSVDDNSSIIRDIREHHLGGVVLFDYDVPTASFQRNIQSPEQLRTLVSDLQAAAAVPLLVSVDYEGGMVNRLKEQYGFPATLSQQALGEAGDLALTRRQASLMAETLAGLGINLNLAPVVDVNTNPDNPIIARYQRSFSSDPVTVTQHSLAFIQAHHEEGVLTTPKHFPGHGSSSSDSHFGLVDISDSWSPDELLPYREIIDAGRADVIMTAHVFHKDLDPEYPATLSKRVITGLLREELGHDGVVISDDMLMGAIRQHYGFETALRLAVEAGLDIIAIANNTAGSQVSVAKIVELIKGWVEAGDISEARIDESYRRIQRLKARLRG